MCNKVPNFYTARLGLLVLAVIAVGAVTTVTAQTTVQGKLAVRTLTRDDIAAYKLPATTQVSAGLTNVAIGEPAYLEAQVDSTIKLSDIANITWELTGRPLGSNVDLLDSPLGADIPLYEPSDREILQVAGRKLLVPDVVGQYKVSAHVATVKGQTLDTSLTITGATYVGGRRCAMCHSGAVTRDMVTSWSTTGHANMFKNGINGALGSYSSSCIGCHTVGYDPTAKGSGGFSDVAAQLNWSFPTVLKDGNYDAVPDALKEMANIQCENCHGPGSQHAASTVTSAISTPMTSGACGQCHGALTHHVKTGEWLNSGHAAATRDPSGAGREGCVGCHTGPGFMARMKGETITNTQYSAINCQTCHEPHGQGAPGETAHLVRNLDPVTLQDGTTISKGGKGLLCMNCHQTRQNAAVYAATTAGSARFGPHHGPQADMLQGTNGFTYGLRIPSSAHREVVDDTCVTCHMQPVESPDPALTQAGGHTFKVKATDGTELVAACQGCHGDSVTTLNFALFDYDGDGKIEGVQTEVQHLLDQLALQLPPVGKAKTSLSIDSTWTRAQLEAAYNWLFVQEDGSRGVHNTAYSVGLLKASLADLSGKK